MRAIKAFWCDTTATTAIEYALIGFFLSLGIVTGATTLGLKLSAKFNMVSSNLT